MAYRTITITLTNEQADALTCLLAEVHTAYGETNEPEIKVNLAAAAAAYKQTNSGRYDQWVNGYRDLPRILPSLGVAVSTAREIERWGFEEASKTPGYDHRAGINTWIEPVLHIQTSAHGSFGLDATVYANERLLKEAFQFKHPTLKMGLGPVKVMATSAIWCG